MGSRRRQHHFIPPGSRLLPFPRAAGLLAAAVAALALSLGPAAVAAQETVSGRVVDAGTLEPLSGVQVSAEGTGIGTLTDEAGAFTLQGLTGQEATLRFRHIGYRTLTRTVPVGSTDVSVQMTTEAVALDEIVVTGTAGGQEARAIGNAVDRLNAAEVAEAAPTADVQGLLGARVSGLRIRNASGEIGTGGSTTIRGVGSLTLADEPLIYVDGVRIDNEAIGDGAAFSGTFGDAGPSRINELNPDDIESIEIIKGPAAATLYGTEASNGVIQIITKKGRAGGGSEVRLQVSQGASWLQSPEEVFPTVWATDPATGELLSLNIVENDIAQGFGSPFSTGHNQGYAASIAGGAEEIQYFISGRFDRNEGIVPYNWENQLNARTNFSFTPAPEISANLNLGFHTDKVSSASAAQPVTTHIIWGTPLLRDLTRGYIGNTAEEFEDEVEGIEDTDRTTVSLNLDHRPLDWFTHRLTVGTDLSNVRSTRLCRPDPGGATPCFLTVGQKIVTRLRSNLISVDYGLTADADVTPDLVASTSVGAQFHRKLVEEETAAGEGLAIRQLETVSATAGDQRSAEEAFLENRTLGVYVQEQLAWKNRVFLTAALRGDDNSAFGEAFDFVTYPKFSASWVLSEEPFFEVGPVSTLRLRGAWGEAGQQPDAFAAIRTYEPVTGPGGQPGLTPQNVGNPELEPEVGRELELGFDAGLLDERLSLEFTYYDQNTKNAIVEVPVLPSRGFPGEQFVNIGEVANSGFELTAGGDILQREDVGFRLDLAVSRNENEIVELGDAGPLAHSAALGQFHVEGFPLASIFQPEIVSAEFDSEGNVVNVMCSGGEPLGEPGPPVPCEEANNVFVGRPTPEWVGSLAATVTVFGNLELYALGEWESGHTRLSGDVSAAHLFFRNSRCIHTNCDPLLAAADQLVARGQGSLFAMGGMMDGGWAKLRTLSATYRLPASMAGRVGANRASFTVSARNLATLWVAEREKFGHRLPDPETSEAQPLNAFIQESWPHFTTVDAVLRVAF